MRAPAGLVSRAKIVLWSASGKTNLEIAQQLEMTNATVGKWRRRFLEQGIAGLHDELRPGRPRPISDERVAQLVRKTRKTKPERRTHWSIKYERLESPGRCGGLMCGREESDASARTYPADVADGTGLRRGSDPRLSTSRDHYAICCTGYGQRQSAHAMPQAAPASRVSGFPPRDRQERAPELAGAHHRGQLRHAQTSPSQTLVR
jgi:Helix-turn-helix domain